MNRTDPRPQLAAALDQVQHQVGALGAEAEAALDWYAHHVPPDARSVDGPFGPVVEVADDADVYTRLAGFVGRRV